MSETQETPSRGAGTALRADRRSMRQIWHDWRHDPVDRFGVVLFFVIATIVVSALVEISASWSGGLLVTVISGMALITTARSVGLHPSWHRAVLASVVLVLVANAVLALAEVLGALDDAAVGSGGVVWLALVLVAPVLVIRRVLAHRVVAMRTVLGAVTAYLQIAVAYAVVFRSVDAWTSAPFFGSDVPSTTYMYVSMTTISTLGLGDYAPVGNLPQFLVSSEAVLGQVFLVTVVAVVISRFAESRPS